MIEYIDIYDKFDIDKTPDEIFGLPIAISQWERGILMEQKYRFLKKIKTKKELIKMAIETNDKKILAAYKVSSKFKIDRLLYLKSKAEHFYKSGHKNKIMTGHAAKGLEFSKVRISPDFPSLKTIARRVRAGRNTVQYLEEEIKLYFVAVSRAKKILIDCSLNSSLSESDKFFIRNTVNKFPNI